MKKGRAIDSAAGGDRRAAAAMFMDDPDWASFIQERRSSSARCRNPTHEDCSPVDPDGVAAHLLPGGTLGRMAGYEPRPGQLDMARAVARAFNDGAHLMIEAGTGVGKSLAYLVPAVQWAAVNDTPVVVSTATRNLQGQLVSSDIPRALETISGETGSGPFRVAVLKGRSNYICLRELDEFMHGGFWALSPEEQEAMCDLTEWIHSTPDGDLDTLGSDVLRPWIASHGEDCLGRRCQFHGRCFVQLARERAQRAHLIVVNHSLALADAANPAAGILPPYSQLVCDEAHNLESIATDQFSFELSKQEFLKMTGRLQRSGRRRRGASDERGLVGTVRRQLAKGVLSDSSAAELVRELVGKIILARNALVSSADAMFDVAARLLSPVPGADRLRYRTLQPPPGGAGPAPSSPRRQYSRKGIFADYTPAQWNEADMAAALSEFEARLGALANLLDDLASAFADGRGDGELDFLGDIRAQTETLAADFRSFLSEAVFTVAGNDPGYVFWIERAKRRDGANGGRGDSRVPPVRLVAAPLSVAETLNGCLYSKKDSVVLCSATLRVGGKFDYMARRLGYTLAEPERARTLAAESPFDYFRQCRLLAADFMPLLSAGEGTEAYVRELARLVCTVAAGSRGRGLVLFTAYDMMRATAAIAGPELAKSGFRLLVQGDGLSREAMVAELKRDPERTVLFGSQSFWEGVDVRGEALSCVVIARIPFPQAGEPIVEARCEKIGEAGGEWFRSYFMPEAAIKFRQGFGRLVRSASDRGVVILADSRVVRKSYGRTLLKSVPAPSHIVTDMGGLADCVREFFDE